jgi:hypothetical protein
MILSAIARRSVTSGVHISYDFTMFSPMKGDSLDFPCPLRPTRPYVTFDFKRRWASIRRSFFPIARATA